MQKSTKILVIILIAVIVLLALVAVFKKVRDQVALQNLDHAQSTVQKKNEPTDLTLAFPADFPFESGTIVTHNYSASDAASKTAPVQNTRTYESKKDLSFSYDAFTKYFTTHSWAITHSVNDATYKVLLAQNNSSFMQITMQENHATHIKTVEVSIFANK